MKKRPSRLFRIVSGRNGAAVEPLPVPVRTPEEPGGVALPALLRDGAVAQPQRIAFDRQFPRVVAARRERPVVHIVVGEVGDRGGVADLQRDVGEDSGVIHRPTAQVNREAGGQVQVLLVGQDIAVHLHGEVTVGEPIPGVGSAERHQGAGGAQRAEVERQGAVHRHGGVVADKPD
ncbi:hypothetical protein SDC9_117343 [bioreactor metagenome]|uniref:Uncharacterized protein n=1 Tax=bioreactor metagenome TaxID=1076179 RepID=A0A645BZ60_9ZZZZ